MQDYFKYGQKVLYVTLVNAIVHYLFRTGPIESLHLQGKVNNDDMKKIMKFAANRLAGMLHELQYCMQNNDFSIIEHTLEPHARATQLWEEPEADFSEFVLAENRQKKI